MQLKRYYTRLGHDKGNLKLNTFKPKIINFLQRSKAILLLFFLILVFSLYFTQRYTIAFNGAVSDCLNARVFLIDGWDTNFTNGDIIAFVMNVDNGILKQGTTWVKKVAATPGQIVHVTHDHVTVGPKKYALSTSYVLNKLKRDFDSVQSEWTLADNEIFMIGETLSSFDSRFWGPIQTKDVAGKAYAIF